LLEASGIVANEQIHVWNINNGERFVTYAIGAERGSGIVSLNGSAARRASLGDLVILAAFCQVPAEQIEQHVPKLVFVNERNQISECRSETPIQG
jgi:aspartate 1-decarboxylase